MPDNLLGGQGATLLTAIIIVAVALLALVGVFWLIRNRAASTFIRGGKNRQPRLAVLDATAVDTRRRLVLIRRDDVEHLVMIGGPTDVVIESRIVHPDQSGGARQAEQQPAAPAAPRPQRASQPAPTQQPAPAPQPALTPARAASPQAPQPVRAPAPASASVPSPEPRMRPAEPAPQPAARQQPTVSAAAPSRGPAAPIATAAAATAIQATGSIRAEAADLLDSARTRVFEEPSFDDSDLDDLVDVPPVSVRPAPAPAAAASAAEPDADPLQAEAADLLENVRTRVFEEPSFDESVFDELSAAATDERKPAAPASGGAPASEPAKPAAPSEFEAVLAAELSQDLTRDAPRDSLIAAHYTEHQLDPDEADLLEAPEVQPETQASRDSLEAEMERLLGDLSRKP
ncbi:MAG: FliO/MopB family protein [Hoeflea sp.]|nr:FliO/MopB family protein [Hoeflea sp.]